MVAAVVPETPLVVMVNVVVVAPAATEILPGTWADELLLDRVTTVPPVGAGPVRVTVPVEELPPVTLAGLRDTEPTTTVGEPPYIAW